MQSWCYFVCSAPVLHFRLIGVTRSRVLTVSLYCRRRLFTCPLLLLVAAVGTVATGPFALLSARVLLLFSLWLRRCHPFTLLSLLLFLQVLWLCRSAHFAILVHFDVPILSLYLLLQTVLLLLWLLYVSLVIIIAAAAVCRCCVGADSQLALHGMLSSLSSSVVDGHFSLPSACIGDACFSCCVMSFWMSLLLFSLWMCVCHPFTLPLFFSAGVIK